MTLQAGEGQVVQSWQDLSSPASGKKISRMKPGQAGRRQREVERKSAPAVPLQAANWDFNKELSGTGLGPGFGFDFAV